MSNSSANRISGQAKSRANSPRNGHPTEEEKFRELMESWTFICPTSADTTTVCRQYMTDEEMGFNARLRSASPRGTRGKQLIIIAPVGEDALREASEDRDLFLKNGATAVRIWVPDGLGTVHKDMKAWCGDDLGRFALTLTLVRPWERDIVPGNDGLSTLNTLNTYPPLAEIEPPIVLPEWPSALDEAAYFGLAGEIVRGIEMETEADPAAILLQMLVAYGNVIGRSAYAQNGRHIHHMNEFLLVVGQTSMGRKGTAWAEVGQFMESVDSEWWNHLGPGLSSGEGLIFHLRDKVMGKKTIEDKKGYVTEYQDVIVDHGATDKRLMVVEPEFARALQAMQREGSTLNAIVRAAFDGGLLRSLTKGFPYQATGAHISIIGHITTPELLKLLASTDLTNGLMNRFLLVASRRARVLAFGGDPGIDMVVRFQNRIQEAVEFGKTVGGLKWTRPAMDLWESQYPLLTAPRPGFLGGVVNRGEAHTLRLASITALINRKAVLEVEHIQAGLAINAFSERCAVFIIGDRMGDRDETAILAYLKCKPDGATRTEIRRDVFGDNKRADHVREKLTSLLQAGVVRSASEASGGRPTERWFFTPPPT